MAEITYVGPAESYHFDKVDFTRHDVDDQGAVTFNDKNKKTAEVSDAAWGVLQELGFGDEFKLTSELKAKEKAAAEKPSDEEDQDAAPVSKTEEGAAGSPPEALGGGAPEPVAGAAKTTKPGRP